MADDIVLARKKSPGEKALVHVGNLTIGKEPFVIAGPCSVESEEQIAEIARDVKAAGAKILRGGAFKPRTSPYSFQGLGLEGLRLLYAAGQSVGLPVITELIDTKYLDVTCEYADILQIGAKNMQNYELLKEAGRTNKPVMIKRGLSATLRELLLAAEYVMKEGNLNVILCERGIRTFETYTRNTLDLSIVSALKDICQLPVVVDPSHATGRRELIERMGLAAIMAGCDGIMVEVHNEPEKARSDGRQAMLPEEFRVFMERAGRAWAFRNKIYGGDTNDEPSRL
jgi:3-deoxy-7-phosphoheptulonate synthase